MTTRLVRRMVWTLTILAALRAPGSLPAQAPVRAAPDALVATAVDARAVEVSRFGSYVAVYDTSEGNTVRVFDADLRPLWKVRLRHFWAGSLRERPILQFAPDETFLLVPAVRTTTDIAVCDVATGEPLAVLREHASDVKVLALSADGSRLVSASRDEIILWRRAEAGFEPIQALRDLAPAVMTIAFAPDGRHVAVATTESFTRAVTLYAVDADALRPVYRHAFEDRNISNDIDQLAFSPDSSRLAAGYRDTILVFGLDDDPRLIGTRTGIDLGTVFSLAWSPDGRLLASGHVRFVRWWREDGGALVEAATTATQQPAAQDLAISGDGTRLYVASRADENALSRFRLEGVGASPVGIVAGLVAGDLSLAQRRALTDALAREVVGELGPEALAPRDMFETAEEYRERVVRTRAHAALRIADRVEEAHSGERRRSAAGYDVALPLQGQGSYDIDRRRYTVPVLDTAAWLHLDRDPARALYQGWQAARLLATRYDRGGLPAYADFRLVHPSGTEYPLYFEHDPFTGERLDSARTIVPAIEVGPDLLIRDLRLDGIYPALYPAYASTPLGRFTLQNAGTGIVTDLEASFSIASLTGPSHGVAVPVSLAAGQSVEAALVAPVSPAVLDVRDGSTATLTLTIAYRRLGEAHRVEIARQVRVLNRNAIQWDDDRRVGSFMSVSHPAVIGWAGPTAAEPVTTPTPVLTRNLLYAIQIYESLAAAGVRYVVDPNSAYEDLSLDGRAIDFLRFPAETLAHGAGDCDDLSVLYATMLESVGVRTAYITTPGHILVAFDTGVPSDQLAAAFHAVDNLIVHDRTVWMPVETTVLPQGFTRAWQAGAVEWRKATERGAAAFFTTRSAWQVYIPVAPPHAGTAPLPDPAGAADRARRELDAFREIEMEPRLARLRESAEGAEPAAFHNRVGVLYARYGLLEAAAEYFERAIASGEHVPALINQANVLSLAGRHGEAQAYLERARAAEPRNPRVLLGLAFSYRETGAQELARAAYEDASRASPTLAGEYPLYGSEPDPGSGRAGTGASLFSTDWAEER